MKEWREVPLDQLFEINRGGSPRPIDKYITDDPDGINWIMIGDAPEGSKYIEKTNKRIDRSGLPKSRLVQPGDFLLTNSMSFGRPYITKTSGCIHDGWLVLSPRDSTHTDADYFYHLLGSSLIRTQFERLAAGAVVKNLNTSIVKNLKVRLPPVDQQRQIAAMLDKADSIRCKREKAVALADELLRSEFLQAFGDPRRIGPTGIVLDDVATVVRGRFSPRPRNDPRFYGGDFPFIQTGEIANADGYLTNYRQTLNESGARVSKSFPKGTVFVAIVGATIGATAIANREFWCPDSVIGINSKTEEYPSEFIEYLLRFWRPVFVAQAPETARANINLQTLKPVPIPRAKKGKARRFGELYRKVHTIKSRLKEADSLLFDSLSQRAFRGEL
jgi:type I restriction enzyme, S subunit